MPRKYMPIEDFLSEGYIQEINRRFLHPLGVALEVRVDEDGMHELGGVWDYRDDPEGLIFSEGVIDRKKAHNVREQELSRKESRQDALGFWIQPLPPEVKT